MDENSSIIEQSSALMNYNYYYYCLKQCIEWIETLDNSEEYWDFFRNYNEQGQCQDDESFLGVLKSKCKEFKQGQSNKSFPLLIDAMKKYANIK